MDLNIQRNNFAAPETAPVQHTIFEIILLIVVSGLFYWFIISPKQVEVDALVQQHEKLQGDFDELEDNERKLNKAISDMKSHQSELRDLDEAIPLDNRVTKVYIVLEEMAQASGMTVGDISVAFKSEDPMAGNKAVLQDKFGQKRSLQKFAANLNVIGSVDQFQGLLQKLEKSGRLININSVNIAASKDNLLNFIISTEAYFYE